MTSGAETMDPQPAAATKTGQLKEQARVVGEDLKKLGSLAKDATREGISVAADRASRTYGNVREKAAETYGQVREKGNELGEAMTDHIRQHPWQSIVIAAGIGTFLGILLSRRR